MERVQQGLSQPHREVRGKNGPPKFSPARRPGRAFIFQYHGMKAVPNWGRVGGNLRPEGSFSAKWQFPERDISQRPSQ